MSTAPDPTSLYLVLEVDPDPVKFRKDAEVAAAFTSGRPLITSWPIVSETNGGSRIVFLFGPVPPPPPGPTPPPLLPLGEPSGPDARTTPMDPRRSPTVLAGALLVLNALLFGAWAVLAWHAH